MPLLLFVGSLIAVCAHAITAEAQTLLLTPHQHPAPAGARAAVTADFNRDGWMDVATANVGRNTVTVLLNAGAAGGFVTREIAVAGNPFSVAHGDVNRDGVVDLAVSCTAAPGSIDVLLLRSDGSLRALRRIAASNPRGVALADFTRDGRLDLAYSDFGGNTVRILQGDGGGGFGTAVGSFAVGSGPQGLAAGDFDHNGRLDLAVANTGSASLSVLYGTGPGTFAAQTVPARRALHELIAVDLNRDSWLDIAATSTTTNNLVLFRNARTAFERPGTVFSGGWPRGLTSADVNHDGHADVLVANRSSSTLTVFLGQGDGNATVIRIDELPAARGARTAVAADFNHDGRIDVAVNAEYASRMTFFENDTAFAPGARTFRREEGRVPTQAEDSVSADFNENGRPDIATTAGVYLDGEAFVSLTRAGYWRTRVAAGDINRDGHVDVVFGEHGSDHNTLADDGMSVYLGDGHGGFRAGPGLRGFSMNYIDLGDLNRDGRLDVVGAGFGESCPQNYCTVLVALNTGSAWTVRTFATVESVGDFGLADLNRDGRLDLVTTENADVVVRHGAGNGSFGAPHATGTLDNTSGQLALAHFNHDGIIDAVVDGFSIQVLLGRSDGTLGDITWYYPVDTGNSDFSVATMYVADFTQDGHVDILGNGHLFEGRGDGSFEDTRNFSGFYGWGGTVVDWNRDGLPDVFEWPARLVNER